MFKIYLKKFLVIYLTLRKECSKITTTLVINVLREELLLVKQQITCVSITKELRRFESYASLLRAVPIRVWEICRL